MTEYADTMSEICEIRAYEEGRLRAFHEMRQYLITEHGRGLHDSDETLMDIYKEIERRIKFTKEVIKEWTYDEEE